MKKSLIVVSLAALVVLAGCVGWQFKVTPAEIHVPQGPRQEAPEKQIPAPKIDKTQKVWIV